MATSWASSTRAGRSEAARAALGTTSEASRKRFRSEDEDLHGAKQTKLEHHVHGSGGIGDRDAPLVAAGTTTGGGSSSSTAASAKINRDYAGSSTRDGAAAPGTTSSSTSSGEEFELSLVELRQLLETLESPSVDRTSREYSTWARSLDRDFSSKWPDMLQQAANADMRDCLLRILFYFVRYMKGNRSSRGEGLVEILKRIAIDEEQDPHTGALSSFSTSRSPRGGLNPEAQPRLRATRILWELQKEKIREDSEKELEQGKKLETMTVVFTADLCPVLLELLTQIAPREIDEYLGPLILELFDHGPPECAEALVSLALKHPQGRVWGEHLLQLLNRRTHIREASHMLLRILRADTRNHFLYTNDAAVMVDVLIRERSRRACLDLLRLFLERNLVPRKKHAIEEAVRESEQAGVMNTTGSLLLGGQS
ncbi:unnamed protein product [Amoebophrya sp. A120]|nr:unnamed protein product [Amoebophrya sp. A120]|eukprot:GSA120T00012895001.1